MEAVVTTVGSARGAPSRATARGARLPRRTELRRIKSSCGSSFATPHVTARSSARAPPRPCAAPGTPLRSTPPRTRRPAPRRAQDPTRGRRSTPRARRPSPLRAHGSRRDLAAHGRAAFPEHEARAVRADRERDAVGLRCRAFVQRDRRREAGLAARREPERGLAGSALAVPRRERALVGRERERAAAVRTRVEHPAVVVHAFARRRTRAAPSARARIPCRGPGPGTRRARVRRRGPRVARHRDATARACARAELRDLGHRAVRHARCARRGARPRARLDPGRDHGARGVDRERLEAARAGPVLVQAQRRREAAHRRPRSVASTRSDANGEPPGSRRGDAQLTCTRPSAPTARPGD